MGRLYIGSTRVGICNQGDPYIEDHRGGPYATHGLKIL